MKQSSGDFLSVYRGVFDLSCQKRCEVWKGLPGQSVSTNTIDALCKLLNCGLTDVLAVEPDENTP